MRVLSKAGPGIAEYAAARRAVGLPVILDLGCGARKVPGAFGVDMVDQPGVDLVHDLEATPYPLPENCADEIHLNHVLEHFANLLPILEEVWRLSRPDGRVLIRTPHYSGTYAWIDPTHHRAFSAKSFHYYGENAYSFYTRARFHVVRVRLKYFMIEEDWPWPQRVWGRAVQWFLDRHPTFGERFLAYLVGGIDEMHVTLSAIKPPATALRRS
ncbi:MAG TPA: methyltransferase domain-containing protein [bacterium]